jgi:addiction module HigA family antidote
MNPSACAVVRAIDVPRVRIERLSREETLITADTVLRLAKYFVTTAAFWMGLQAQHDLERGGRTEKGLARDRACAGTGDLKRQSSRMLTCKYAWAALGNYNAFRPLCESSSELILWQGAGMAPQWRCRAVWRRESWLGVKFGARYPKWRADGPIQ